MLQFLNAGESHGRALVGILTGIPSGLNVSSDKINQQLKKRQKGYGRGARMQIEADTVEILSGVRGGKTIGSPISFLIENKDYRPDAPDIFYPRPGHADIVGSLKYNLPIRDVLERASARNTAITVVCGTICRTLLEEFDIGIAGSVVGIGSVKANVDNLTFEEFKTQAEDSNLLCADRSANKNMIQEIDRAKQNGDTVGGTFQIRVKGLPPGIGSYTQPEKRLTSRLGQALFSIPAIKGVEFGLGFRLAELPGSKIHDPIMWSRQKGYYRKTNNSGGLEGGMTTGEILQIQVCMKPISTLLNPIQSVDIRTRKTAKAAIERSDICAVPAACVIGESQVAYVLADAFLENFTGNNMQDINVAYKNYVKRIKHSR
jgi:chorismate synthase